MRGINLVWRTADAQRRGRAQHCTQPGSVCCTHLPAVGATPYVYAVAGTHASHARSHHKPPECTADLLAIPRAEQAPVPCSVAIAHPSAHVPSIGPFVTTDAHADQPDRSTLGPTFCSTVGTS